MNSHPIIYCPTNEGVSKVSEQVSEWAQWSAQVKQANEWPSTAVWILGCSGPQCSQRLQLRRAPEFCLAATLLPFPSMICVFLWLNLARGSLYQKTPSICASIFSQSTASFSPRTTTRVLTWGRWKKRGSQETGYCGTKSGCLEILNRPLFHKFAR